MAKQVIFLVHGMGEFEKGWSRTIQKQITDLYSSYDASKILPFSDHFEFEEVTYNNQFKRLRDQWKTGAGAVQDELRKGKLQTGAINELAKYATAPTADNFLATHLLDVFLYRFVKTVAEAVRTQVANTILGVVLKDPAEPRRFSVIAHSLGTSVVHDALHAAFTTQIGGGTLQGRIKAQVLAMIANVSRLLESDVDVYRSVTHPGAAAASGVCWRFINAKHEWDPFPRPKEFRPIDDWPDPITRSQGRYQPVTINAFQSKNVHSLSHYVANPKVHVPLFRALIGFEDAIPPEEFSKAHRLFEANTPFGRFETLQKKLKKFQIEEQATWREIIKAYKGFLDTIKDFESEDDNG